LHGACRSTGKLFNMVEDNSVQKSEIGFLSPSNK
jgi:hypothetical protein